MYTRCQGCHTVHPVNAALLAQGSGKYRCGKCKKINDALAALFDQWPDPGQDAQRPGIVPELGHSLTLEEPDDAGSASEAAAQGNGPDSETQTAVQTKKRLLRLLWVTAGLALTIIITVNVASYFRQPLLDLPRLQPLLIRSGIKEAPPEAPFRDLQRIELVSREMKTHPARPGVLLLNATIINRAERQQQYPDIDVTLLDMSGRTLQRRLFRPDEYLTRSSELRTEMKSGAYLTFSLEMLDPGEQAVGFELQFR